MRHNWNTTPKKHLVSLWFDTSIGNYGFTGYVYGNVISTHKLFRNAFGFELPNYTTVTYG